MCTIAATSKASNSPWVPQWWAASCYLVVTQTQACSKTFVNSLVVWWARLDSNQEPTDYESAALTVELRARVHILHIRGECGLPSSRGTTAIWAYDCCRIAQYEEAALPGFADQRR